ncbi:MAG: hypothetical protein HFG33_03655 [Bacilli bacterium]|nr:hypothetical protein [Bacilli bacterium]
MIYVPEIEHACYVLVNKDTIRAYTEMPYNPSYQGGNVNITYRDYYVNSHYLFTDSYETFSYYSKLPVCLDKTTLTTAYFYRNDAADIMLLFVLIISFLYFIISIFLKAFFKGLRR